MFKILKEQQQQQQNTCQAKCFTYTKYLSKNEGKDILRQTKAEKTY